MARTLEKSRLIRATMLPALLTLAFAAPMHSQSNPANPVTAESKISQDAQEPNPPAAIDRQIALPSSASPEETRQAQIEVDTKKLYQLSAELRAEVAKTYKESLSLTVLKKAEEVEKLAKSLKVLMSQQAAASKH